MGLTQRIYGFLVIATMVLRLAASVVSIVTYTAFQFVTLLPFLLTGYAWPIKYSRYWKQCHHEMTSERKEFFYNWLQGRRPWTDTNEWLDDGNGTCSR
jgi:hypothetical protein